MKSKKLYDFDPKRGFVKRGIEKIRDTSWIRGFNSFRVQRFRDRADLGIRWKNLEKSDSNKSVKSAIDLEDKIL